MTTRPASTDAQLVSEWLAAAARGDLPAMKRHFAAGPGLVDALGKGPYWTGNFRALHYAAYRGDRKVIRWLLARGASATPIAKDSDWAPIHFAAVPPKPDIVRMMIEHGAQMDIFTAAALGDAKAVHRMLRDGPTLVNNCGPDGGTPLHFAASPEVARVLLDAGADPVARDRFHKQTPAQWAHDRPDVLAVLVGDEADHDIHLACAIGDLRRVKALVREDPTVVDAKVGVKTIVGAKGETPLGTAARYGQRKVVGFLLERGALAASLPSPLPAAVEKGHRAVVKRLLEAGADPNGFDAQGHAALHMAAAAGNLAMIRLLMASRARLDLKDKEHKGTPLAWAVYHKRERAAAFLRDHGAV